MGCEREGEELGEAEKRLRLGHFGIVSKCRRLTAVCERHSPHQTLTTTEEKRSAKRKKRSDTKGERGQRTEAAKQIIRRDERPHASVCVLPLVLLKLNTPESHFLHSQQNTYQLLHASTFLSVCLCIPSTANGPDTEDGERVH